LTEQQLRTYHAIVWRNSSLPGEGEHITLVARDLDAASAQVKARYGQDAVVSLWNEEDANAPRPTSA
jgi:hypothetical protein